MAVGCDDFSVNFGIYSQVCYPINYYIIKENEHFHNENDQCYRAYVFTDLTFFDVACTDDITSKMCSLVINHDDMIVSSPGRDSRDSRSSRLAEDTQKPLGTNALCTDLSGFGVS